MKTLKHGNKEYFIMKATGLAKIGNYLIDKSLFRDLFNQLKSIAGVIDISQSEPYIENDKLIIHYAISCFAKTTFAIEYFLRNYDFTIEKEFEYYGNEKKQILNHIAKRLGIEEDISHYRVKLYLIKKTFNLSETTEEEWLKQELNKIFMGV